jgi:hypothetical protein
MPFAALPYCICLESIRMSMVGTLPVFAKVQTLRLVLSARAMRAPQLLSFLLEPALHACEALSILYIGQLAHTGAAACSIVI